MGINGRNVSGKIAVLDPVLTASCPHWVSVGSGLDAMVHSLEAFMTTRDNPLVHEMAIQAYTLLFRAFPEAINNRAATHARLNMLAGAYLAGIAVMYSGGGIAGALSYPLGGEFGVPHGIAGGILLQHIIKENINAGYDGFAELHLRLFPEDVLMTPRERSKYFLERFCQMLSAIRAPEHLGAYVLRRSDVPSIVEQTIKQRMAVLRNNPTPVNEQLLTRVLQNVILN
jgi:alcohol dehydrogenase